MPEFENAVRALDAYGLSDIVESSYGYHILYRPEVSPDHIYTYDASGNPVTVRYEAATGLFRAMVQGWADSMELEFAPDFDLNAVLAAGQTA